MNEFLALLLVGAFQLAGYYLIYPRAKNLTALRMQDLSLTIVTLVTGGIFFASSPATFWIFGWKAPWFAFLLAAYVLLEIPIWLLFFKRRPHLGTVTEFYGFSSKANREKLAKNIDDLMRDTRWDKLRSPRVRRLLVVLGYSSLLATPVLFLFERTLGRYTGFGSIALMFLCWWLLRISVRLVADAPDEYLDEFQIRLRNSAYLESFRVLATVVTLLGGALILVTILTDSSDSVMFPTWTISMTFGQINSLIWSLLGWPILTPNLVLAWKLSKGDEPN